MSDFNNLIGNKFKRNKYGLSSWTDIITEVGYLTNFINREYKEIKPFVIGSSSSIYYDLDEIVIVVDKLNVFDEMKISKMESYQKLISGLPQNPKYLYRPSDYSIFQLTEDGYTHQNNVNYQWIGNKYDYNTLINLGFKPCTEDDFDWLKEKHDEYYEYLSWLQRSDGHGGVKGGTFDEFLKIKNKK